MAKLSTISPFLRLKHLVATSGFAGAATALRGRWRGMMPLRHPELGLLSREDDMIDAVLVRRIGPDWNCLDIGAHLGSVYYRLTQIAPRGTHAMIEASPSKARMLRERFGDHAVHEVAVTDETGEVSFFENIDMPGFSSLANRASRGRVVERRVKACRLDDLIGDARVDFIKIDIEGFEYPALRGATGLLKRCRPLIEFEAGAATDSDLAAGRTEALFDWLTTEMDYDIYAAFDLFYDRPPITARQFASYRSYPFLAFNYFAVPKVGPAPSAPDDPR